MAQTSSAVMAQTAPNQLPNILEKPNKYTCMNCRVEFQSAVLQRAHFKTEWHLYNLKRKVCNLDSIDQNSFDQIQQLSPSDVSDTESSLDRDMLLERTRFESSGGDQMSDDPLIEIESDLDSNWEEIDEDELLDEDYDDAEMAEMLSKIVPENVCLFCNKRSADIKMSIKHMESAHGFFIPEEKYLIDRDGLIEYLGFKVGAGTTCLWCSKQFTTLQGVRLHMMYKDHCKIKYDQDQATGEFKDFYDYSAQVQIPMKSLHELTSAQKRRQDKRGDQTALVLRQKVSSDTNRSRQLFLHKNPITTAGTFQSKNFKKFNSQKAKTLLRVALVNNGAVRGRLRRQNPM